MKGSSQDRGRARSVCINVLRQEGISPATSGRGALLACAVHQPLVRRPRGMAAAAVPRLSSVSAHCPRTAHATHSGISRRIAGETSAEKHYCARSPPTVSAAPTQLGQ